MFNKIQILVIVLVIPLVVLYMLAQSKGVTMYDIILPGTPVMHIGEIPLRVEIANTDAERNKGLSGRNDLSKKDGMLFVFSEVDVHGIWMKDMKFPIDIIWIDEDLKVINIEKNVTPETYPKTFRPQRPALYAVETKTLFSDTFGLRAGLEVRLPVKYDKK